MDVSYAMPSIVLEIELYTIGAVPADGIISVERPTSQSLAALSHPGGPERHQAPGGQP